MNNITRYYESQIEKLKLENERNRILIKSIFEKMIKDNDKLKEDNVRLLSLIEKSYLQLQIESNKNIKTAIETDSLRAQIRNEISAQKGISCEEVQIECESKATH